MTKQTLLLVGSSGFLGKTLYQKLSEHFTVIPTHTNNKVFEDSEAYNFFTDDIKRLMDKHSPDIVVMAAAVEKGAEENFGARVQTFVTACKSCYLVYISSDALFDGKKGNYKETDPPSPITPYGRNLVYFEKEVQTQCSNFLIIRPSYLFGYSMGVLDSRLQKTKALLDAGETVSYFDDMFKSPLEVNQAASFMTQLISQKYQGLVHVAGERKSVYRFQLEALQTLKVNTSNLTANKMPLDLGLAPDTSLDTSLLRHLTT
jgi:dTDP-4-dehydrorhamnose reductase